MKLRHAAALAAVGWYLMVPPTIHSPSGSAQGFEPINQWLHIGSFDTASACERGIKAMVDSYKQQLKANPDSEAAKNSFNAFSDAQCIATDDPRLKEK